MKPGKQKIIALLIVIAGILAFVLFLKFRVKPEKIKVNYRGPLVEVIDVETKKQPIVFQTFGTVISQKQITLLPQVSGKIIKVSKNFTEGGRFKKNEVLVYIEDTDYKLALKKAQANLLNQEVNYKKALKQADIAKEQWEEIYKNLMKGEKIQPDELTLHLPQLKAAKAAYDAAKADLELAKLNLSRTKIKAPFDGYIISKNADTGQVVSPQTIIATIYSIENLEVISPANKLEANFIKKGDKAKIILTYSRAKKTINAIVDRFGSIYNSKTKMIDIYIKPLENTELLKPGDFVTCLMEGKKINCAKIPINSYRDGKVWIYKNGKLIIKKANLLYEDENFAYISGLPQNFKLIVTNLYAVSNGMKVRLSGKEK